LSSHSVETHSQLLVEHLTAAFRAARGASRARAAPWEEGPFLNDASSRSLKESASLHPESFLEEDRSMSGTWFKTLRVVAASATLLVVAAASAQAQNAVIRGTIASDGGQPIGGANVYIAELGAAAVTTDNGRYTLTIAGDRVRNQQFYLRVRAIGFRPSSRLITVSSGDQTQDFTLVTDINRLEEIVVTGVLEGTEQAKVPFAVARVDFSDVPVTPVDPLRALVGRVPGATITSFSGRPGAAPEVILRGPRSINASGRGQGPLYIVDGTIIQGSLPEINPADIENVEVVQGAAASSLYGARGGNGVITITTRSGRRSADGLTFQVAQEYGRSDIERNFGIARNHYLIMDERGNRFCRNVGGLCAQTIDWGTEAARINNEPGDFAATPLSLALDVGGSANAGSLRNAFQANQFPGRVYDAVEQAVTPNAMYQTNVDATGRYGQTQFFVSGSYLNQQGALRFVEGFQRYTGRLNVDHRIGSAWSVAFRSYYARSDEDFNAPSFFRLTRAPAIVNTLQRDTLGRMYIRPNIQGSGAQNENPLYTAENLINVGFTRRFIGGVTVRYAPAPWIDVEGNFAYDYSSGTGEAFQDKGYRSTQGPAVANGSFLGQPYLGYVFSSESNAQSYNTGVNVTMRRNLSRDLATRWTLRYAYDQQDNDSRSADGTTLVVVGVRTLGNASVRNSITSSFTSVRGASFAAGTNLEFKERYVVDAVLRREGSSLFGADARWSTFGRASAAWRISREPWWFAPSVINDLKLRASYGTAGGRPNFSAQYETFGITTSGPVFGNSGNRDLRPEKTFDTEIGLDAELFRRIGVNMTIANSETRDQILLVRQWSGAGNANRWENAGTLENKTFELAVNVPVISRRDLAWSMRFSYDRTRTTITELNVPPQRFGGTSQGTGNIFLMAEGERYGAFYGRAFITSCDQLPDHSEFGGIDFRTRCGTPTSDFQRNSDGFIVWTGGYAPTQGITSNLWGTSLGTAGITNANAPWGRPVYWGMPITIRDTACVWRPNVRDGSGNRIAGTPSGTCAALQQPLGNALPDWNFSVSQSLTWRKLSVFALLQGVMGRDVYNQGRHWAHLDLLHHDIDQFGRSVEEARPIGYYWRSSDGGGVDGFYDILDAQSNMVEDASYAKLREVSVSYQFGRVGGIGNWTASLVGRNLFTITNYSGFDPETGLSQGISASGTVVAVDAFNFPNTRSLTFRLSTSF
jgi:TonB-linked SusC/RagA family outer membrane protein